MAKLDVRAIVLSLLFGLGCVPALAAPPVFVDPGVQTTPEDVDIVIPIAAMFTDPDGDLFTFTVVGWTNPAIDTAVMNGSNLEITLIADANGVGGITVNARDFIIGDGTIDDTQGVFGFAVTPINDAPRVVNPPGPQSTNEDVDVSIDLSSVFTEPDTEPFDINVLSVTNAAVDTAIVSGTDLDITLVEHAFGTGTIRIEANDNNGGAVPVDILFDVISQNDVPVVDTEPGVVDTDEDNDTTLDMSGVFDDADGDTLILNVTGWGNAAIQNAVMNSTTLEITVAQHAFGSGTVTVEAADGNGGSETVDVTVNVDEVNDAPEVLGSVLDVAVAEDAGNETRDFSGVFVDVDDPTPGDPISLTLGTNTNVALFDTVSLVGTSLTLDFAADAAGGATITVIATDREGATDDYDLNVSVTAVNDRPHVANPPGSILADEDSSPTLSLAGVFDDVDPGDVLTLSVDNFSHPAIQSAAMAGTTLGIALINNAYGDGTVTVIAEDIAGDTETVDVNVSITERNDGPVASGSVPLVAVLEDAASEGVDLSGVFTDPDDPIPGDPLSLSLGPNSNAALFDTVSLSGATLNLDFAENQNGTASITFIAEDREGLTVPYVVNVDVTAVNDEPFEENPPPALVTVEDVNTSVNLAGVFNDVDIATNSDSLSLSLTTWPNPPISVASISGTVLSIDLVQHAYGTGVITVTATDNAGATEDVDVNFTVTQVNDDPFLIGNPPDENHAEDAPPFQVDISGLFGDADIADGESLSLTVVEQAGFAPIFASFSAPGSYVGSGELLDVTLAPDMHGEGYLDIIATDGVGPPVTATLAVNVTAVNDAPYISGAISDIPLFEDDPTELVTTDGFDDVDIYTNGDSIQVVIDNNTNSGLFSNLSFSGEDLTITLVPDANGTAKITVHAEDQAGLVSPPVTFQIIVDGTNDVPDVQDDSLIDAGISGVWNEDMGEIRFPVLDNDYQGDLPAEIVAVTQPGPFYFIDGAGDFQTQPSGEVLVDGDELVFIPTDNFYGNVSFTYNVQDSNGDIDPVPAEVAFNIEFVNDAPETVTYEYFVEEDQLLVVPAETGLLSDIYDVDRARTDVDGNPLMTQTLAAVFTSSPPGAHGNLSDEQSDGSFRFTPLPGWDGTTSFTYAVSDGSNLSGNGTVLISVDPKPDPADPPNPGEVAELFNLANSPLEQATSVLPNVVVAMDDSGSMDWNFSMDMQDEQGRFPITNNTIANSSVRYRVYSYLWDLPTNTYNDGSSCCGRILPTEASLTAAHNGNDYGVWRARSSAFNGIYYNPEVRYEPWAGLDPSNVEFANATPTAIRLDPRNTQFLFDITALHSYRSTYVPLWQTNGSSANLSVNNVYIPTYYEDDGTRVEIRSFNAPFASGEDRADCAIPTACTYDEELLNFANWFQYYRSRGHLAKAATGNVISELQDIRVGFETINRKLHEPIAEINEYYWEGEKEELLDEIYRVPNGGGTPLRRALNDAGTILNCTHSNRDCPALVAPEGICQKNYTLLFSDGYWNGSAAYTGNADTDGAGDFDGGKYADGRSSTLADVAMHYYETDMFPSVEDGVPVTAADVSGAPDDYFTGTNENLHQHMKTYTIAFGVTGSVDVDDAFAEDVNGAITWPDPFSQSTAKIDDMLHAALNGRGRFLNAGNPQELQTAIETAFLAFTQATSSNSAAAFNSTSLREDTLFYRAFYNLRNRTGEMTATEIDSETGQLESTTRWAAAERLDPSHAEGLTPSQRTIVTYNPDSRQGVPFQYSQLTTSQRDILSSDQVYFLRGDRSEEMPDGLLRERLTLEGILGDVVNSSPVFVGEPLGFDRDQEPYPIIDLYSTFKEDQRDRQEMIYVGANDGMLHGFDADTGVEQFAYVPNIIIDNNQRFSNKLDEFTSSFYLHNYYVDQTPKLNDVYMNGEWRTVIVGGLGAGGKGFYALDVTEPENMFTNENAADDSVLWEFSASDDTYPRDIHGNLLGGSDGAIVDPYGDPVKDLGYSLSVPVVTMSNVENSGEREWVAVFGNGPNSTSGIATLFILFMEGGQSGWNLGDDLFKISTGYGVPLPGEELEGYPNGLGSPAAVDLNRDGAVDYVYAGDRLGNLFRFDVTSDNPSEWEAVLLFQAVYDDGGGDKLQPILAKPVVLKKPDDMGFLVTFGTGSFMTEDDGGNTDIQSIYTIWDTLSDNPDTAEVGSKYSRLVEQEITNFVILEDSEYNTYRRHSSHEVTYTRDAGSTEGVYGWYIDLDMERAQTATNGATNPNMDGNAPPAVQFPGEKAIRRWLVRGSPKDGRPILLTTTILPATNETACFGIRPGSLLIFDAWTGGNPNSALLDSNNDKAFDEDDLKEDDGEFYSAGIVFGHDDFDGALVDPSTLSGQGGSDWLYISGGTETRVIGIASGYSGKINRLSWTQIEE